MKLHGQRYKTYKLELSQCFTKNNFLSKCFKGTVCVREDGHLLGILKEEKETEPSCYLYGSYSADCGFQFAKFDYKKNETELEEIFLFANISDDYYVGEFLINKPIVKEFVGDCMATIEEVTLSKEKEEELKWLIINANQQAKVTIPQSNFNRMMFGERKFVFFDDDEPHAERLNLLKILGREKFRIGDFENNCYYLDKTKKPN